MVFDLISGQNLQIFKNVYISTNIKMTRESLYLFAVCLQVWFPYDQFDTVIFN